MCVCTLHVAPLWSPMITTMATTPPLTTFDPSLAALTTPRSTLSPDNQSETNHIMLTIKPQVVC